MIHVSIPVKETDVWPTRQLQFLQYFAQKYVKIDLLGRVVCSDAEDKRWGFIAHEPVGDLRRLNTTQPKSC